MRRLAAIAVLILVAGLAAGTLAQDTPATPVAPTAERVQQAEDAAARAETAAANAEQTAAATRDYADGAINLANTLMGLFQNVTAVTGILIPLLAGVAAFVGIGRLNSAQNELSEARKRLEAELESSRERFEREMNARQAELNALRDQLRRSADEQRTDAARTSLAQSLIPLGERQYRSQDYAGALDTYRRALELDPDNLIIHYRLGYVYTQSGQLEEAEKHLTSALQIEPDFGPALATLGYVYRRMSETMPPGIERDRLLNRAEDRMLAALNRSPKLVDEDGESWWGSLGGLYRRRGQIDQAVYAYERATEVTPHSSYGFGNLATLYGQKREIAKMKETYKRVEKLAWGEVQAEVDNYWAYADLITARLALGKVNEAFEVMDTVLETAPAESPYTLESLIDTLTRLADLLNGEDTAAIKQVIAHTRAFLDKRKAGQEVAAQAELKVDG